MVRRFKSRATAGRLFLTGTMVQFTDAADIVTTAARGDGVDGTLDMGDYTEIAGVAAAEDVRLGVDRYTGGPEGALVGIVDMGGYYYASGIFDGSAYYSTGILDAVGAHYDTGVFNGTTRYATTGLAGDGSEVKDGVAWHDGDSDHEGTYVGASPVVGDRTGGFR